MSICFAMTLKGRRGPLAERSLVGNVTVVLEDPEGCWKTDNFRNASLSCIRPSFLLVAFLGS